MSRENTSDNAIPTASRDLQLSFIIKYLLPDTCGDMPSLCYPQAAPVDGSPGKMMQSGSVSEGLSLPNMLLRQDTGLRVPVAFNTDLDYMKCKAWPDGVLLETWHQDGQLKPAYCRLRKQSSADGDDPYYSSAKAREKMVGEFPSGLIDSLVVRQDIPDDRAAVLLEAQQLPMCVDVILAVCVEWPDEVSEWRERSRPGNWPSRELIDRITTEGIHLVPKAHACSQNKDVEWRLSFSLPEIRLGKTLREEQRLCYLALKALHHMELKEPEGLTSYHLKTVLLWTCEKTAPDLWTMDQLGRGFLVLLEELLRCLRAGCISSYFIPECNLIDVARKEDIDFWIKKLEAIRKDPIPFLIRFHDLYRRMTSLEPPLCDEDAIQDRNGYATGIRLVAKCGKASDPKSVFVEALFHLGLCYAAEGKFLDMAQLAAHFDALQHKLTMDETPSETHPSRLRLVLRFMEALVRHHTASDGGDTSSSRRMMTMVNTNLARLHHEASKVAETASERDQSLANAYESFTKVTTSIHHDASDELLFANFLYDQRRLDEAIAVLTATISSGRHASSWCTFVVFNEYTAHTPDDFLKEEFLARKEVEYWVPTFTLYLLISCYVDKGDSAKARELLPKLFDERERSSEKDSYADTCVLLGYCYLRLGERGEALKLFKEAVDDYASDSADYWYEKLLREMMQEIAK